MVLLLGAQRPSRRARIDRQGRQGEISRLVAKERKKRGGSIAQGNRSGESCGELVDDVCFILFEKKNEENKLSLLKLPTSIPALPCLDRFRFFSSSAMKQKSLSSFFSQGEVKLEEGVGRELSQNTYSTVADRSLGKRYSKRRKREATRSI